MQNEMLILTKRCVSVWRQTTAEDRRSEMKCAEETFIIMYAEWQRKSIRCCCWLLFFFFFGSPSICKIEIDDDVKWRQCQWRIHGAKLAEHDKNASLWWANKRIRIVHVHRQRTHTHSTHKADGVYMHIREIIFCIHISFLICLRERNINGDSVRFVSDAQQSRFVRWKG